MIKASLLYRCKDQTGESATWLSRKHLFLWVDIDNGILHQYDCRTNKVKDNFFPDMITAIIPKEESADEVIIAMKNKFVTYDLSKETFHTLSEMPYISPMCRSNDCKASPDGKLWYGVMNIRTQDHNGELNCMDHQLKHTEVLDRQSIPNGIVWNRKGDTMYYADSGRSCVEAYSYNVEDGTIRFLKTALDIPKEYGIPDGMTIDNRGYLWVAHWGGNAVCVWNPDTGEMIDKVIVPVPNVASCTFGGENGNQLFITTARSGLTERELAEYPLSGSLFVADIASVFPGENHYCFKEELHQ